MLIEVEIGVVFELLFGKSSAALHQKKKSFLVSSSQEENSVVMCEPCVVANTLESVYSICVELYL